jgi:hypothetical protein
LMKRRGLLMMEASVNLSMALRRDAPIADVG